MAPRTATVDLSFPHNWDAKILLEQPLIAPATHFFYPAHVEEVELGALEVLLRPEPRAPQTMATFALGFADPSLPHGIWSCPNPSEICAVAGGYAYVVNATRPKEWAQISYRPVVSVTVAIDAGLLIFAGYHRLIGWGADGQLWETEPLSAEGLRITKVEGTCLQGLGWDLVSNTEIPFAVDLATGLRRNPESS